MKYEIINPSDPYTIEHSDFLAVATACLLLGNGQYALRPFEDGAEQVPMFLFGGFDKWWEAHSPGVALDAYIETHKATIAEAMESVSLTSGRRSSMNDIGGRAAKWATHLREGDSAGPTAPQQVFSG